MRYFHLTLFICMGCLPVVKAQNPAGPGVMQFFAAQSYDALDAQTRIREVYKLQKNNWYAIDTIVEWDNEHPGKSQTSTQKRLLEPFMDESGRVVYLVPEVGPQFPGEKKALDIYKRDVLGNLYAGPEEGTQSSVYIRCTIDPAGHVQDVAEAQQHSAWIAADTIAQCLDAVRYMPDWSPGMFRGKPVCVAVLIDFSLK